MVDTGMKGGEELGGKNTDTDHRACPPKCFASVSIKTGRALVGQLL